MQLNLQELPAEIVQAKQRYGIVGNAPGLIAAVSRAIQVAPIDLSVLVTGESGTGKEFFPKIIHGFSSRKHSKYIAVNCGAIPEGTIDSELFGHEKGSFTGAISSRKGYFEEADGGTIFLDEVAELPLTTQARLLRVLESGEFIKVGSSAVQRSNVRIVAATNVDMAKAVAEGRFREDLYYRLSTVSIQIPPLRDRGNDIALLARKFASDFAERYTMPAISFDDSARAALLRYRWPGNVRQLKNVVEQIALFESGNTIDSEIVGTFLPAGSMNYTPVAPHTESAHEYESERDALFGMILRLQHQIEALNIRIDELTSESSSVPSGAFQPVEDVLPRGEESSVRSIVRFQPFSSSFPPAGGNSSGSVNDVVAVQSSPVTLEDTERDTIRRALERNGGKRKEAARELNISERTLYRKIKDYGIDL
ncbi:sigma-54 dependent transcriptional regulator [uncultured Duncaniella sp.]|jgi:transcriptional regulator with PAS, ATPase and Fis domain|uniref:sigma-54 interaction domain-containing protein n=1 Tax=uncultured Duncaniella sp. TaxID=2768039 RepID=UPI000F498868|nr:sigma-54 dependent transcriptional regulator [uncultured Duncaniella sp.]ROS88330.1 sigma-54-dependent Fis family transcriptional regulator [Muribaculaceae bacterium Isolate-080 (Janvier)]